jgi:hypothetical protein
MSKATATGRRLTIAEARRLPPTIGTIKVAELLGWSENELRTRVNAGSFPVEPIRRVKPWVFPTAPVLKLLGIEV